MITCRKIENTVNSHDIAYWIINDSQHIDFTLFVEVHYVDIFCNGYVYDITAYCLESNVKIQYKRVKSCNSLLKDKKGICDYFENDARVCKNMSDFGFKRSKIKKKELENIKKNFQLS